MIVGNKVNIIKKKGKPVKVDIVKVADETKEIIVGREGRLIYNSKISRFEKKPVTKLVPAFITVLLGKDESVFIVNADGKYINEIGLLEAIEQEPVEQVVTPGA